MAFTFHRASARGKPVHNPSFRSLPAPLVALGGLLALVVCGLLFVGQGRISFSTDYRDYFRQGDERLLGLQRIQQSYDRTDNVLFAVAARHGDIFTPQHLETLAWATEQAWQAPHVTRVDSLTNFQHSRADGEGLRVAPLMAGPARPSEREAAEIRTRTLAEPLLVNRLIAPDGATAGIELSVLLPGVSPMENYEVVAYARDLAARIEQRDPGLDVHLTGLAMYNQAFFEAAMTDEAVTFPIAYGLAALAMLALTRNVVVTVVACAVAWLCRAAALGASGWMGVKLTSLSLAAPLIVMIVCVVYAVHVASTYLRELEQGRSPRHCAMATLSTNLWPLTLIAVTTVIGLLSLSVSEVPPFQDLGRMAAIGVAVSYLMAVFVLPWCLALLPVRLGRIARPFGTGGLAGLASFAITRRRAILTAMTALVAASLVILPTGRIDDTYSEWFDTSLEFRQANDFTVENLTGLYSIDFDVGGAHESALLDPAMLAKVDGFARWLREQPETVYVFSVTDIVKTLNQNLHGDDAAYRVLPSDAEAVAQAMLMYEMSLPYGQDLTSRVSIDKSRTRVTAVFGTLSTSEMLDVEARAKAWLDQAGGMTVDAGSVTLIFAHIGDANTRAMAWGVLFALALIAAILALVARSVVIGMIAVLVNVAPIAVALALWIALGGTIGLSLAIMGGVALGIVVDGTIHFILKYRSLAAEGLSAEDCVRGVLATSGIDVAIAAVVVAAGFATLTTSVFALNVHLGLSAALAVLVALGFELLVLPALLVTAAHPGASAPLSAQTVEEQMS